MRVPLSTAFFPGVPEGVAVHAGFRNEHALTATQITAEVKRLVLVKSATQVMTVRTLHVSLYIILGRLDCDPDRTFPRRRVGRP